MDVAASQFVFRRNRVVNARRNAVLAKGDRGLVEKNHIQGCGGSALALWNAPYEGLCATGYVFRGNDVLESNQLMTHNNDGTGPIFIEAFAPYSNAPCHRGVLVENNTFTTGPGNIFTLGSVAQLVARNNDVTRCATDLSPLAELRQGSVFELELDAKTKNYRNTTGDWICKKGGQ